MTVNVVAFSLPGCAGSAADNASAAEAPQMAVAPPVRKPNSLLKPSNRAAAVETRIVTITDATTASSGAQLNCAI